MKAIALFIAALMVLLGLTGMFWPEGLMELAKFSFTPNGIYVTAIVRVIIGALLLIAAGATRAPKAVRVIGLVILVAGIASAFITAERAASLQDWLLGHGPNPLRIAACVPLLVGLFIGGATLAKRTRP